MLATASDSSSPIIGLFHLFFRLLEDSLGFHSERKQQAETTQFNGGPPPATIPKGGNWACMKIFFSSNRSAREPLQEAEHDPVQS